MIIQFKHGLSQDLTTTSIEPEDSVISINKDNLDTSSKSITLRGRGKTEIYSEITDKLNQYNLYPGTASQLYMCVHSPGCIVIRGEGASRGCLKYDDNHIITEIRMYDDDNNFGKQGLFKPEDKVIIADELTKFIGYKIN